MSLLVTVNEFIEFIISQSSETRSIELRGIHDSINRNRTIRRRLATLPSEGHISYDESSEEIFKRRARYLSKLLETMV